MGLLQTINNNYKGLLVAIDDKRHWEGLQGDYKQYTMPLEGLQIVDNTTRGHAL